MQYCLKPHSSQFRIRGSTRHGTLALRPLIGRRFIPSRSVSKSAEVNSSNVEPPHEKHDEQKKEDKEEQTAVPAVIDAEATPVVAVDAKEATSEPMVPADAEKASGGDEAATPPPSPTFLTSHRLEDVPEQEEEDIIGSKELVAEVMDGSAFGKRGEQWLAAQIALVAMILFPPLTLKGLVDFCATLSLTTGLVFIATAIFNLGRNISPLPEPRKKHQLVVSGIYGYVRHPMYGGLLLAALGLAVLTRNETRVALVALLWWVLEKKLAREEEALSARYPEYAEYKAKVKKFFPFIY